MSDNVFRRLSTVHHRVIAGLAGKPTTIVHIEVPGGHEPAPTNHPPVVDHVDDTLPTTRAAVFQIGPSSTAWLDMAITGMKSENVDPKDTWVHVHCNGPGDRLTFATRWRDTVVGVVFPDTQPGVVDCYVRFVDMEKLVKEHQRPDIQVTATHLMYSTNVLRGEIPYAPSLPDNLVKPPRLPTEWMPAEGLWRALHEAFDFTQSGETFYGFSAVHVKPHRDGTNQVSVMGVRDTQAYRRVITVPNLISRIAIPCAWAFGVGPASKKDDILWLKVSGLSRIWLQFSNGVVIGAEIPQSDLPQNLDECFEGLDGRQDFTVEEMRTLRRALLSAKPFHVSDADAIGITPSATGMTIRDKAQSIDVPARGDAGEEILVDPELLTRALKVQDLLSLEFKKGDPEHRIRFTGRDVAVVISTCTQPV